MKNKYEKWLMDYHYKLYPSLLDDDIPDHFDDWLGNLDVEDWMSLGGLFVLDTLIEDREETIKNLKLMK